MLNMWRQQSISEITVYISGDRIADEQFTQNESYAGDVLRRYEGQYFNELPEFGGDASIENIGEVFFRMLDQTMKALGLTLKRLEIGENPLKQYVISTYR